MSDEEKTPISQRSKWLALAWWIQIPIVSVVYFVVSKEPFSEKLILIYLAIVSIIANAVGYESRSEAAKAKENQEGR